MITYSTYYYVMCLPQYLAHKYICIITNIAIYTPWFTTHTYTANIAIICRYVLQQFNSTETGKPPSKTLHNGTYA